MTTSPPARPDGAPMREVRPTIRALKSLPRETYDDPTPLDIIGRSDYDNLDLYGVDHPLLVDARKRFGTGLPDRHQAATRAHKEPVYEVRDRDGAGWRGAVVLDDNGDPWLVWVERHNQFHKKVMDIDLDKHRPAGFEYTIRDREEAAATKPAWQRSVLEAFVGALRESVQSGDAARATVAGFVPNSTATLEVEAVHGPPSTTASGAHAGQSLMTVTLKIVGDGYSDFKTALLSVCLPFLEPDPSRIEPAYGSDGSFNVCIDITHAQIIQLLSDPPPYEDNIPVDVSQPDRLHYVGVEYLLDGYVHGHPLRGVCGVWFVASRTEACGLPVCERCEEEKPAAQQVLDMLRSSQ